MRTLYSLLAFALFGVNLGVAQGTFQFTWHGESNFFQASFEVTSAEMQPGAVFSSDLFLGSMSVTDPLGQSYHGGDSTSAGSGTYIPWGLSFQLNDFQRNTEVLLFSGDYAGSQHRTSGGMWEKPFSDPNYLWAERGYWSVAQVPEPSAVAVLATGTLFLLHKRRARRK